MILQNPILEFLKLTSDAFQGCNNFEAIALIFDHQGDVFELSTDALNVRQAGFVAGVLHHSLPFWFDLRYHSKFESDC